MHVKKLSIDSMHTVKTFVRRNGKRWNRDMKGYCRDCKFYLYSFQTYKNDCLEYVRPMGHVCGYESSGIFFCNVFDTSKNLCNTFVRIHGEEIENERA